MGYNTKSVDYNTGKICVVDIITRYCKDKSINFKKLFCDLINKLHVVPNLDFTITESYSKHGIFKIRIKIPKFGQSIHLFLENGAVCSFRDQPSYTHKFKLYKKVYVSWLTDIDCINFISHSDKVPNIDPTGHILDLDVYNALGYDVKKLKSKNY